MCFSGALFLAGSAVGDRLVGVELQLETMAPIQFRSRPIVLPSRWLSHSEKPIASAGAASLHCAGTELGSGAQRWRSFVDSARRMGSLGCYSDRQLLPQLTLPVRFRFRFRFRLVQTFEFVEESAFLWSFAGEKNKVPEVEEEQRRGSRKWIFDTIPTSSLNFPSQRRGHPATLS
jgi:hypothetical protein